MSFKIENLSPVQVLKNYSPVIRELRPQVESRSRLEQLLKKMTESEDIYFWGITYQGEPTGFCSAALRYSLAADGKYCFVYDLIISKKFRSQGFGKQLLDHVCDYAKEQGCKSIELESGTSRSKAHQFYFKQGFNISCFNFVKRLDG